MPSMIRFAFPAAFARLASIVAALLALAAVTTASAQTLPVWEIVQGGRTAYVIGTLHLGKSDFFPLPETMHGAFDWAEVVAVELDSTRVDLQREVARRGTYREGADLEKAIGEEAWRSLQPALAKIGLDTAEAQRMRPWLLASTMTVLAQARSGYLPDLAVDAALARVAKANGRTLAELETFADQAALLDEMSEKHGRAWLSRVADQITSGRTEESIGQLADAWRAGDLEQVGKLVEAETTGDAATAEIATRIAESRARGIGRRIGELIGQGKRTVFAIHVANLAGPKGVMQRLVTDGFRIRQLTLQSEIAAPSAAGGAGSGAGGAATSGAAKPAAGSPAPK